MTLKHFPGGAFSSSAHPQPHSISGQSLAYDFVGKNIPTSLREVVAVRLRETDGETGVSIYEKDN